jgi:hypothetical protein
MTGPSKRSGLVIDGAICAVYADSDGRPGRKTTKTAKETFSWRRFKLSARRSKMNSSRGRPALAQDVILTNVVAPCPLSHFAGARQPAKLVALVRFSRRPLALAAKRPLPLRCSGRPAVGGCHPRMPDERQRHIERGRRARSLATPLSGVRLTAISQLTLDPAPCIGSRRLYWHLWLHPRYSLPISHGRR